MKESVPSYLSNFSKSQQKIILHPHPVKQVVAAAGSGKTRTVIGLLMHQIKNQMLPDRMLVLTFSRKAAGELRERLPAECSGVEISTFHSFCFRHLKRLHHDLKERNFGILEEDGRDRLLMQKLKKTKITGGIPYDVILHHEDYFREEFPNLFASFDEELKAYKEKNHLLEYSDLVTMMLSSLKKKEKAFMDLRSQYDLIVIDEFQDTDFEQLDFIKEMNPSSLLVVGDDYQAIYGFRGATVAPFMNFKNHFPGAAIFTLSENYRSKKSIIQLGARVIKESKKQLNKKVISIRGKGLPVYATIFDDQADLIRLMHESGGTILVRSNRRRAFWIERGISENRVMTIHKAKGLEFGIVFFDLCSGWNSTEASMNEDEEIRIAYVGVTRAKDLLVVLHKKIYEERQKEKYYWTHIFSKNTREVSPDRLRGIIKKLHDSLDRVS